MHDLISHEQLFSAVGPRGGRTTSNKLDGPCYTPISGDEAVVATETVWLKHSEFVGNSRVGKSDYRIRRLMILF